MEEIVTLLIPTLLTLAGLRLLLLPMKLIWKIAVNSLFGFLCLWLLNLVSGITGIFFPINAVTVLTAGVLGLPGIGILAFLAAI